MFYEKKSLWEERRLVVEPEVRKLMQAKFIREVQYTPWLANVILIKKGKKWKMCTNYTGLNKKCRWYERGGLC